MAMVRGRGRDRSTNWWPGYVDVLASLLLAIFFLLSVYMIAQFYLSQELLGRDTVLSRLNSQIAELTEMLQLERVSSDDLESTIATLSATLAGTEAERDVLSSQISGFGAGTAGKDATIAALAADLEGQIELTDEQEAQVALLNQQLSALRTQIGALEAALGASESRDTDSRSQIADLGRRLNLALAQRVQDLSRYRSDFFGRLREILGDRPDIRIVGDRFVFQSELLFASGEANISAAGGPALTSVADAILELEQLIPPDIHWVLRIDGHTDRRPISTARFPSNWELSAARAISVAKFMVDRGVSPNRLVAAGFGEFQPIDPADNDDAYRRNRRIEFKLTE
ncbi:MAG: peptidoglycan -binding protein [Cucumibacter sp.]